MTVVSLLGFSPGPRSGWWLGKAVDKPSRFIVWLGGHFSMGVRVGALKANGPGILPYPFSLEI